MSRHTGGWDGDGWPSLCHQITHGGGGSKIGQNCNVLFEWPLTSQIPSSGGI